MEILFAWTANFDTHTQSPFVRCVQCRPLTSTGRCLFISNYFRSISVILFSSMFFCFCVHCARYARCMRCTLATANIFMVMAWQIWLVTMQYKRSESHLRRRGKHTRSLTGQVNTRHSTHRNENTGRTNTFLTRKALNEISQRVCACHCQSIAIRCLHIGEPFAFEGKRRTKKR